MPEVEQLPQLSKTRLPPVSVDVKLPEKPVTALPKLLVNPRFNPVSPKGSVTASVVAISVEAALQLELIVQLVWLML